MMLESILAALRGIRVSAQPEESEIHACVAEALRAAGLPFVHEFRLAPGRRIDFACGSIGIEVKKGKPASSVLCRQLERYLESPQLSAVIVVMQRPCSLPGKICNKPVYVVSLNRLWGIALP